MPADHLTSILDRGLSAARRAVLPTLVSSAVLAAILLLWQPDEPTLPVLLLLWACPLLAGWVGGLWVAALLPAVAIMSIAAVSSLTAWNADADVLPIVGMTSMLAGIAGGTRLLAELLRERRQPRAR